MGTAAKKTGEGADSLNASQRLLEALVDLSKTESIHRVQVQEICARAHVSRTTFYKSYEDMPDFLARVTQDFIDRMNSAFYFGNVYIHMIGINSQVTYRSCIDFMMENGRFVRMMIGPNGSSDFRQRITDMWVNQLEEALIIRAPQLQKETNLEILSRFVACAMWGMLEWNLDNEDKYPRDYIAQQMSRLVYDSTLGHLLSEQPRNGTDQPAGKGTETDVQSPSPSTLP